MKKIYFLLLVSTTLLTACQKSISDFDPSTNQGNGGTPTTPTTASGSFEATINGTKVQFTIFSANLLRSALYNQKRIDIAAISTDNTKRIIITLGEETSQGNSMSVKKYVLNAFPPDDPATPNIDESNSTEGFSSYSTGPGSNNWVTNIYDEDGTCTVTSCDANTKLISATFTTTLIDLNDSNNIVKITAGKITNVKYTVLN